MGRSLRSCRAIESRAASAGVLPVADGARERGDTNRVVVPREDRAGLELGHPFVGDIGHG